MPTPQSYQLYDYALVGPLGGQGGPWFSTINCALMKDTYVPNLHTDQDFSVIQTDETSGTGYSAGGVALANLAVLSTPAASWGTAWAAGAAYALGAVVVPTASNGLLYYAAQAGTSGTAQPAWPTVVGETVTDGTVIWTCIGATIIQLTADDAQWTGLSVSFRYAVIFNPDTTLFVLVDYGATITLANQSLDVPMPSLGWAWFAKS